LSGRGLCDELITRPEESYRLCCVVVCDLETSRMGAHISSLRVKLVHVSTFDSMTSPNSDMSITVTSTRVFLIDLRRITVFGF
jgi:hypothetical protein